VARRRASALFDLVGGFVYSQVLLACVRLRMFEHLADGPQPPQALAARLHLAPPALDRLLHAAAALELVEPRAAGRWGLGPLGALLVGDQAIAALVQHHEALYADLADPVALLRGNGGPTRLEAFWPYAVAEQPGQLAGGRVGPYSALMSASQPLVAEQVLGALPLNDVRCLMDVGGGEGAFLAAVASQASKLRLMLFDLPAVAERATARLAAQGLAGRVQVCGGDFHRDVLPQGADLITLVRVLHDHDDEQVLSLLRAVRRALPPEGSVLVAEPMAGTPGAARMGDAYFGFYLLAMRRGRPRSRERLTALLREAGFDRVRELPTRQPLQTRVLRAWPAATPGPKQSVNSA
jgi:demethylspheroidene O-methyltransferase